MDGTGRERARWLGARRAVVVPVIAGMLTSCSNADEPQQRSAPTAPRVSTGNPTPTRTTEPSPPPDPETSSVPTAPADLAHRLDAAIATLRDRQATEEEVRDAGELQQLAVRTLALGSARFRRDAFAAMGPAAARQTRGDVRAAQLLTVITEPKPKFPPWQIVEPPPVPVLLGYYREAQRRTGVPWAYLAAIHLVETRMGRIRGPSTAGALGPMQFLPTTWTRYGEGGDINDPHDAIQAAARLLGAHGAPADMAGALRHYNPSDRYVAAVTEYARTMQRSASAYRGYWHWRVLYHLVRGTFVLPTGYPTTRPVPVPDG